VSGRLVMSSAERRERRADRTSMGLLIGLLLISGSPAPSGAASPIILLALATWAAFAPGLQPVRGFSGRFALLALAFGSIFLLQWRQFGFVSWPACVWFLAKLLLAGFVVHRIGPRFAPQLLRAVALLSLWSLVGYALLLLLGPTAFPTLFPESVVGENLKSLLFMTVQTTDEWWRNSGPFWEPGAFQGVINLALLLAPTELLLRSGARWRVLVMVAALVTTFSTTGYIVFFLVMLYKIAGARALALLKAPLLTLALGAGALVYMEADFLGQKIAQQAANTLTQEDFTPDRFGALVFDLQYIAKSPWIGNGLHEATRYADHPHLQGEALGHGNGLSNHVATLGVIGSLVYFGALWRAGPARGAAAGLMRMLVVALLAFGEPFLLYPLFMALPFVLRPAPARPLPAIRRDLLVPQS
jgi:hypothetical protein